MSSSFSVDIDGIKLEKNVLGVDLIIDGPDDSEAKAPKQLVGMKVTGRVITSAIESTDESMAKVIEWALKPPSDATCYRKVTVEFKTMGKTDRRIELPEAFVVDLLESFGEGQGDGTWTLNIRNKLTSNDKVKVTKG